MGLAARLGVWRAIFTYVDKGPPGTQYLKPRTLTTAPRPVHAMQLAWVGV